MLAESEIQNISTLALCGMLVVATVTDSRQHRIPNTLVLLILLAGLIAHVAIDPIAGTIDWAAGLLTGFAIFLPFYVGGGMGAGDIKLMAAVTAFLAPAAGTIAAASALIAGMPLALIVIAYRRLRHDKLHSEPKVVPNLRFHHEVAPAHEIDTSKTKRIPYAAAIATGATIALWWSGRFDQMAGALTL